MDKCHLIESQTTQVRLLWPCTYCKITDIIAANHCSEIKSTMFSVLTQPEFLMSIFNKLSQSAIERRLQGDLLRLSRE